MEIDVTPYVNYDGKHGLCSGSVAELGDNASRLTWESALKVADDFQVLKSKEQLQAARDHFHTYGAWDWEEINAWSPQELNALVVQEVQAEVRRLEEHEGLDLQDLESLTEEVWAEANKNEGGRLGPGSDGKWYYYLGV
jgi:hypothetical protein